MSVFNNLMNIGSSFTGPNSEFSDIEQAFIDQGIPLQSPLDPYALGGMAGPTPFRNPVAEQTERDETQAMNRPQQMMQMMGGDDDGSSIAGNMMKMFMGLGF
jgi:hypothetical protein